MKRTVFSDEQITCGVTRNPYKNPPGVVRRVFCSARATSAILGHVAPPWAAAKSAIRDWLLALLGSGSRGFQLFRNGGPWPPFFVGTVPGISGGATRAMSQVPG